MSQIGRFEKQKHSYFAKLLNRSNDLKPTSVPFPDWILCGEKWLIAGFEKSYSNPRMTAFEHFFFIDFQSD